MTRPAGELRFHVRRRRRRVGAATRESGPTQRRFGVAFVGIGGLSDLRTLDPGQRPFNARAALPGLRVADLRRD